MVAGLSGERPSVISWMNSALVWRLSAYFVTAELAFARQAPHQYADANTYTYLTVLFESTSVIFQAPYSVDDARPVVSPTRT